MLLKFLKDQVARRLSAARFDANASLAQGIALHKQGRIAEAEAHYRAVLRARPRDAEALYHLGVACRQQNRLDEALRCCQRACKLSPGHGLWIESLKHIANDIGRSEGLARCEAWVREAGDWAAYLGLGNALREAGRLDEAEAAYRKALELDPNAPVVFRRLGSLLAVRERLDEADACFAVSARAGFSPDGVMRLSGGFLDQLERERDRLLAELPKMQGDRSVADRSTVVFLSCDPVYFRTFAHPLTASLLRNGGDDFLIHLHVINPDSSIAEEIALLRAGLGGARLIYTFEQIELMGDSAKTYYACARFLHLPALLKRYGRPVLVLDMDLLVLGNLDRLTEAVGDSDVGIIRWHPTRWDPWDTYWASAVYVRPTALQLAERAALYIQYFLGAGRPTWYLDQAALFAVLVGSRRAQMASLCCLPVELACLYESSKTGSGIPAGALFWSVIFSLPSNRSALAERPFLDYLPAARKAPG